MKLTSNIIRWIPLQEDQTVLWVGPCNTEVTDYLESQIQALDTASVMQDVSGRKYDMIICIGELHHFLQSCEQQSLSDCFALFYGSLKEDGRLLIAAPNRFGLTYFAGKREEGTEQYFSGIESRPGNAAFTRQELTRASALAGFAEPYRYYPFPGHQTTFALYSEDHLPKKGELIDQISYTNSERIVLFDETVVFDTLIEEARFEDFANSFLFVFSREKNQGLTLSDGTAVRYVKFSNDRGQRHNIRTMITEDTQGGKHLLKMPDSAEADEHIRGLCRSAEVLTGQYRDSIFTFNQCNPVANGAELEFLRGCTMEEEIDSLLDQKLTAEAEERLLLVIREIQNCPLEQFKMTEEFRRVFGEVDIPQGLLSAKASDIDMVLSNIIVTEAGDRTRHTVIDYEWTFHFPIPIHFVCYRTIHYFIETTEKRRVLHTPEFYKRAGISEDEILIYRKMEQSFQSYILDGHIPLRELKPYQCPAYHIKSMLYAADEQTKRTMLQIYADRGNGFGEEDSTIYFSKSVDGNYQIEYNVDETVRMLRIDPGSKACTVEISRLNWKGEEAPRLEFQCTGHRISDSQYLFETEDPYILVASLPEGRPAILQIELRTDFIRQDVAELLVPKIDLKYRIKKLLGRV